MKKKMDLHIHTCYSDGEYTPMEIVNLAVKKGLGTIAITDHDTVEGLKLIDRNHPAIKNGRIEVINGIELTAKPDRGEGKMHILGYGIDPDNEKLIARTKEIRQNNIDVTLAIYEQTKKDYGIFFSDEDIQTLKSSTHNVGRPDLAKLCVKYGYSSDVQDAFDRFLNPAREKVKKEGISKGISWKECIRLIRDSGGVAVFAHPNTLKIPSYTVRRLGGYTIIKRNYDFDRGLIFLLKTMVVYGLQGIEAYHSSYTEEETQKYLSIARKSGLLVSGGSDFHGGTVKPDVKLGTGRGRNLKIKQLSLVDYLHRRGEKNNGENI